MLPADRRRLLGEGRSPPGFRIRRDHPEGVARRVDEAKVNWAHLAIAQLMKHGFVDRVLTTNFDLLVVRACAMVGHYPALYDFATSQALKPADIPGNAVFYLHGQPAQLLPEARSKFIEAEAVSPGAGSDNLACVNAVEGREDECKKWLQKSKDLGTLPSRDHLLNDADLESVRDREWFQAFLENL